MSRLTRALQLLQLLAWHDPCAAQPGVFAAETGTTEQSEHPLALFRAWRDAGREGLAADGGRAALQKL